MPDLCIHQREPVLPNDDCLFVGLPAGYWSNPHGVPAVVQQQALSGTIQLIHIAHVLAVDMHGIELVAAD
ncbi:MAG: hypothetical protein ABSH44_17245 [Bryobacteraceae bacterium]